MHIDDGDGAVTDPRAALADVARLRARTQQDRGAWWFPLVLFGVLVLAATPLYWSVPPDDQAISDPFVLALVAAFGGVFTAHPLAIAVYWLVALTVGFVGSGLWYRRHAHRVGLRRPVVAFVVTGLAVTMALLLFHNVPYLNLPLFYLSVRGTSSITIIAVGLFVLARLERSRGLLVFALAFLAVAVLVSTYNVENLVVRSGVPFGDWTGATPVLVPGLVLLIGGLTARLAGVGRRRPDPVPA